MNHRRNGKVARLPKKIRNTVNQMLEDGKTYAAIVKELQDLGHPGFNMMNISTWKAGGFRDWHAEQERLACIRDATRPLHGTDPNAASLASDNLASRLLTDTFTQFDPEYLRNRLAKHPERYFSLILAYSRLIKSKSFLETLLNLQANPKPLKS
jgi:hypothetical protein